MKKETIIRKINKIIKELEKEKANLSATGRGRSSKSLTIMDLKAIKMDVEKLE